MKLFVAAIALDRGVVNRQEKIYCEMGDYRGKGFGRIGEYEDHAFGDLTVREILVESSNIGMAKIGQRLKAERMHEGLLRFGFGQKTGIHLPGEARGMVRPLEQWDGYSVTRVPFGQEISVTALQLVKGLCILVNHGRLVRPHIIAAFVDSDGKPQVRDAAFGVAGDVGYIVDPDIARWIVQDVMVGVVNEGTGHRARLDTWQVFGKTGTGEVPLKYGRGYEEGAYISSFLAGAPAEDPAIVILVSIRKPNLKLGKGYGGGTVAAPVAGRIIERTLEYMSSCGWVEKPQLSQAVPDAPL
jgi:cell division protein FtsI/penicillin-binding protein 2